MKATSLTHQRCSTPLLILKPSSKIKDEEKTIQLKKKVSTANRTQRTDIKVDLRGLQSEDSKTYSPCNGGWNCKFGPGSFEDGQKTVIWKRKLRRMHL